MKFKKLVVLDNILLSNEQRSRLESCSEEIIYYWSKSKSSSETIQRLSGADSCVSCWTELPREVFEKCPQLAYIGFWGHWFHHRIDAQAAQEHNVVIDKVPDYATDAVSEIVFAGILERARFLSKSYQDVRKGSFDYEYIKIGEERELPKTWLLKGKTLGIIGLGRIGKEVAKKGLYGFGMNVVYYSRTRNSEWENKGIRYKELDDLLRESDVISVHVGHDCEKELITRERIKLLKNGSLFVNTSVGSVVDEIALIDELKTGRISTFLDVYHKLPPRKELKDLPNVLLTYRKGWFTQESLRLKGDKLIENIEKYLSRSAL
ncbi:MAG: 2-hydroxyacid dehydrogenase [Nanoarchaeota archaeon]|nr:2-hydroxyacid dehydrogenase [Nanoarchaeota archaeon]